MYRPIFLALAIITAVACKTKRDGEIRLSTGEASICVPQGFTFDQEENGATTVVYSPDRTLFELRFTYHSLAPLMSQRPNMPSEFVGFMAEKKQLQTRTIQGTAWRAVFEPLYYTNDENGKAQHQAGTIALKRGYLTFTLSTSDQNSQKPEFKQFSDVGLEKILESLVSHET